MAEPPPPVAGTAVPTVTEGAVLSLGSSQVGEAKFGDTAGRDNKRSTVKGRSAGRDMNNLADIPPGLAKFVDDQRESMLRLVDVVLRQADDMRAQIDRVQDEVRESIQDIREEVRDAIQRVSDEGAIYRRMDSEKDVSWRLEEERKREARQAQVDRRDRLILGSLVAVMIMAVLLLVVLLLVRS